MAITAPSPSDPARLTVRARDDLSGIASGAVELQRVGSRSWQVVRAAVTNDGLTAVVDDKRLRAGHYRVRATATNAAGLSAATERDALGKPVVLTLPLRAGSRVVAHVGGRTSVRARVGSRVRARGRVTGRRRPVRSTPIEVWRRIDRAGASWTRVGTTRTSKTGRFSYRAPRGPAACLRFRYGGSSTVREQR